MSAPVQSCPTRPVPPCPGRRQDPAGARPPAASNGQGDDQRRWQLLPGLLPLAPFLPAADLVIVDVETTGWLADEAAITEIGAIRLSPGRPPAEFSALVNPGAP